MVFSQMQDNLLTRGDRFKFYLENRTTSFCIIDSMAFQEQEAFYQAALYMVKLTLYPPSYLI